MTFRSDTHNPSVTRTEFLNMDSSLTGYFYLLAAMALLSPKLGNGLELS